MIISASRRTDLPAFYSDWFFNRIKAGYALVRNPVNPNRISKIDLSPDVVDGIVFWTKNPIPMLDRLHELAAYPYYFQFTLTAYGGEVEPGLPSKNNSIIPAFQRLASQIGKEKVIWRYDPVFLNDTYTVAYHCRYFRVLAAKLSGFTEKCTVSFLDFYKNTGRNMQPLQITHETKEQQTEIIERFSEIARSYGLCLETCAENTDFEKFGVKRARCIDPKRFERIGAGKLSAAKDPNQRPACGCAASIDIGAYHTCNNGCLYCYANSSRGRARKNAALHDPHSPLLIGTVGLQEVITERKVKSCRVDQQSLFDESFTSGSGTGKEENGCFY